jgi:hypothetical protein
MADLSYQPKVYRKQGGDVMVIAAGGQVLVEPGGSIMAGNPTGAADYFVDLNVSATGDGSINSPFATLAEAITASNTSIGLTANRWWARRNRIFVMGDGIEEDLTVLPEKCDIIGCGSDLVPYPRVIGHHTIAAAKVGCRLINMGFQLDGTAVGITIPAGCHGFQIIGGMLQPSADGNTVGVQITASALVKIQGFEIHQNPAAYGTGICGVGIAIAGTASNHQTLIDGCFIEATEGIDVVASAPAYGSRIQNNLIKATALCIDENSDVVIVAWNELITAANGNTDCSGAIDANAALAIGNRITSANTANCPYPIVDIAQ